MTLSAAKNAGCVTVVTDPDDYDEALLQILINGDTTARYKLLLALKGFKVTAEYDRAIQEWIEMSYDMGHDVFAQVAAAH